MSLIFKKKIKISIENILKIHAIIVKDTQISLGFKKIPNYLLMRNVKTTPPEYVKSEIQKLISWYDKNKLKTHPLKLISYFHATFERIHPFDDGNGRVGRILINIILLDLGYFPIIIRKAGKLSYFNALEAYDNNHKDKLERFLLKKIKFTYVNFFEVYTKYL